MKSTEKGLIGCGIKGFQSLILLTASVLLSGWPVNWSNSNRITFQSKAVSALISPGGGVRAQLIRMQKESGLTIASYSFEGPEAVLFDRRAIVHGTRQSYQNSNSGAVSRDGKEIALLLHAGQNRRPYLGIVHMDGSGLQEYPEVETPTEMCWSYDQAKLAVTSQDHDLIVLNLATRSITEIDPRAIITSQCWSPDNEKVVYEAAHGNLRIFTLSEGKCQGLVTGTDSSWSPDGNWIAYHDGDNYYLIHPSGEGKKILFHKTRAVSGLYWSPDSRFVAYVHQDFFALDTEFYHLIVRRLEDNSEDWVADNVDGNSNLQWIANRSFLALIEDQLGSKR
jgi:WD40 repeat protein